MTHLPLPHEVLYLMRDPEGAGPLTVNATRVTLAAAVAELSLRGRIALARKKIELVDPSPIGSAVPDGVLAKVQAAEGPLKIGSVVMSADWTFDSNARPDRVVLAELVRAAVVRSDPKTGFQRDRFVPMSPGLRASILAEVTGPLSGGTTPTPRQAERIGILALFRLLGRVTGHPLGAAERRTARKITDGAAAAGQLRSALTELELV